MEGIGANYRVVVAMMLLVLGVVAEAVDPSPSTPSPSPSPSSPSSILHLAKINANSDRCILKCGAKCVLKLKLTLITYMLCFDICMVDCMFLPPNAVSTCTRNCAHSKIANYMPTGIHIYIYIHTYKIDQFHSHA
jgi:hypothetical protein